jgi:coatomer subunit beta
MFKGILEPLLPAVFESLKHKHSYVRRNAVSCLYIIYLNFKDAVLPDVDEYMETLLQTETDLSTKRNAFMLFFNSNQAKAIEYINKFIVNDSAEDLGDIMQLAVLELLRKTCKFDPSQKSRLMKAIFYFSNSKSSSGNV